MIFVGRVIDRKILGWVHHLLAVGDVVVYKWGMKPKSLGTYQILGLVYP